MTRVANPKNNQLINITAKMMYSQIEETNGNKTRKFYPLDLEIDRISLFVTTWTIVHPITTESPLFNLKHNDDVPDELFRQTEIQKFLRH